MKKILCLGTLLILLFFSRFSSAQEKFIDVRQNMADSLTGVKTAVKAGDWTAARRSFDKAKTAWTQDVKPLITEGVKTDAQFQEYFNRISEVEANMDAVAAGLEAQKADDIEAKVNAAI